MATDLFKLIVSSKDRAELFPTKMSFSTKSERKRTLDNGKIVLTQLLEAGVDRSNLAVEPGCTICDSRFESARRDGESSGRMTGTIEICAR